MSYDYEPLKRLYGDRLKLNEPLARYTVARLGGPADARISVGSAAMLNEVAQAAWQQGIPTRIIGGGANVLFSDLGYRGLIIINDAKTIDIHDDGTVKAESGAVLTHIARQSMSRGLAGFEWAVSVPGTLGGAIVNNAGAHGSDTAAVLTSAEITFPNSKIETWPVDKLNYHYRESALKRRSEPFVVLSGTLQLELGHDPAELQAKADGFIAHRKTTQPPGASLGSMFKNPPGDYAGRLIEAAGLKGKQIGGVMISPVHANFFVNTGGGTASDYLSLTKLAQQTVKDQFGVDLELEVELIGEGFDSPSDKQKPNFLNSLLNLLLVTEIIIAILVDMFASPLSQLLGPSNTPLLFAGLTILGVVSTIIGTWATIKSSSLTGICLIFVSFIFAGVSLLFFYLSLAPGSI